MANSRHLKISNFIIDFDKVVFIKIDSNCVYFHMEYNQTCGVPFDNEDGKQAILTLINPYLT